jgi:hypothetical protein
MARIGPECNLPGFDVNAPPSSTMLSRAKSGLGIEARFNLQDGVRDYLARFRAMNGPS